MTALKLLFSRANFFILHYAYFILLTFLSSIILWGSSKPAFTLTYVDSLFLVVSAVSGTGLSTVNISSLTTWQQVILMLLIMLGGSTLMSIWTNAVRKRLFVRRMAGCEGHVKGIEGKQREEQTAHTPSSQNLAGRSCNDLVSYILNKFGQVRAHEKRKGSDSSGHMSSLDHTPTDGDTHTHLLKKSRMKRALTVLGVFVRLYYILWQLLGSLALGAWIANRSPETAKANHMNPWWAGIFNGVSAFNNSGLSLIDANLTVFQKSPFVIITMGLMILAGNTMYPIFLRFILWSVWKLLQNITIIPIRGLAGLDETLKLILKHPRRFHTHLFPARHTWWLLFTVLLINTVGWVGFELINIRNPAITPIPVGYRILDGLFQAISTRSGGFSVFSLSTVYPSTRLMYIFMMYIPVLPVAITRRRSSKLHEKKSPLEDRRPSDALQCVYQSGVCIVDTSTTGQQTTRAATPELHVQASEKSAPTLCDEAGDPAMQNRNDQNEPLVDFIWRQMHHHFAQDVWMLCLSVFLISVIENSKLVDDPASYNVFNIVFEVVSGYGCVGVSTGLPTASYSFSGGWHGASKVILCFVMMFGRHRLLPLVLEAYDEEDDWDEDEV